MHSIAVVERMNQKYLVIGDYGSKCVVGWKQPHAKYPNQWELHLQGSHHVKNLLQNKLVVTGKTKKNGDEPVESRAECRGAARRKFIG
jgi:hypothetical protein